MTIKILLLGGNGFIGSWLRRTFNDEFAVNAPSRAQLDLVDRAAVGRYIREFCPDVVIHSASQSDNRIATERPDFVKNNILIVMNVIDQLPPTTRCVWIGSGAVYGRHDGVKNVRETAFTSSLSSVDLDFSRGIISRLANSHANVIELRPFGVYGPGEDWRIRFISFAICRALHGLPIVIRQDRRMSYVHVEDLCELIRQLVQDSQIMYGQYNVSDGKAVTLSTIAGVVHRLTGSVGKVLFQTGEMAAEYTCSNEKISTQFPSWRPRSIEDGVLGLIEWYRARLQEVPLSEISIVR